MDDARFFPLHGERQDLSYHLTRKKVKNINLRLHPDGSLHVSASRRVSRGTVERFLLSREGWVTAARERLGQRKLPSQDGFSWEDGARLPYRGGWLTLRLEQGEELAFLRDGVLVLRLADPGGKAAALGERWCVRECRLFLENALTKFTPLVLGEGTPIPPFTVKRMKSRWGSCSLRTGKLHFNLALLAASPPAMEAVVVHELAHFRHPNHGPDFYRLVLSVLPDYHRRTGELKDLL